MNVSLQYLDIQYLSNMYEFKQSGYCVANYNCVKLLLMGVFCTKIYPFSIKM